MSAHRELLPALFKQRNGHIFLEGLQSLFLYGASGLVALGYYLNERMGTPVSYFPVLWFAGSLYVYNLDRLVPDYADTINLPERSQFAGLRKCLIVVSLSVLILLPTYQKNWLALGLLLPAIGVSSLYSLTPPGFTARIKDVPWLKWLAPPLIIMGTLTIPAWIHPSNWALFFSRWPVLGGTFAALLINILLFDQRDRLGDSTTGLKTIANQLTPRRFFYFLLLILSVQVTFLTFDPQWEMLVFAIYLVSLIFISRKKRSPNFYHWAVDGMLFIPLICLWLRNKF